MREFTTVESCLKISVSDLPLLVKKTFLSEVIKRLYEENVPIIKEEIPFE